MSKSYLLWVCQPHPGGEICQGEGDEGTGESPADNEDCNSDNNDDDKPVPDAGPGQAGHHLTHQTHVLVSCVHVLRLDMRTIVTIMCYLITWYLVTAALSSGALLLV